MAPPNAGQARYRPAAVATEFLGVAHGSYPASRSPTQRPTADSVGSTGASRSATTAEIAAHPTVDIGRRQVFDHLETLRDRGALDRHQNPDDGRAVRWGDTALDQLNDHGAVDLDTDATEFDTPEIENLEVAEPARIEYTYTWGFLNSPVEDTDAREQRGESPTRTADQSTSRGDPPPEGAD